MLRFLSCLSIVLRNTIPSNMCNRNRKWVPAICAPRIVHFCLFLLQVNLFYFNYWFWSIFDDRVLLCLILFTFLWQWRIWDSKILGFWILSKVVWTEKTLHTFYNKISSHSFQTHACLFRFKFPNNYKKRQHFLTVDINAPPYFRHGNEEKKTTRWQKMSEFMIFSVRLI